MPNTKNPNINTTATIITTLTINIQNNATRIRNFNRHNPPLLNNNPLPDSHIPQPHRPPFLQFIVVTPPVKGNTSNGIAPVGHQPAYADHPARFDTL